MNYAEARELADGSGWHFTVRNNDSIWPHACCCTEVPATAADVARLDVYMGRLEVGDLILGPPHEPHATREQAEECLYQWMLASVVVDDPDGPRWSNWQSCEAPTAADEKCGAPTKNTASFDSLGGRGDIALCDEHRTVEIARSLVPRVSCSVYS